MKVPAQKSSAPTHKYYRGKDRQRAPLCGKGRLRCALAHNVIDITRDASWP